MPMRRRATNVDQVTRTLHESAVRASEPIVRTRHLIRLSLEHVRATEELVRRHRATAGWTIRH